MTSIDHEALHRAMEGHEDAERLERLIEELLIGEEEVAHVVRPHRILSKLEEALDRWLEDVA